MTFPVESVVFSMLLLFGGCETDSSRLVKGWAEYRDGNCETASRHFTAVLQRDRRSARALYGLGLARLKCKDFAGAEHWLARSVEGLTSTPEQDDAMFQLSELYLLRHNRDSTYVAATGAMADQLLARDPRNANGHLVWARLSLLKGEEFRATNRKDESQQWYRKSIEEFSLAGTLGARRPEIVEGSALASEGLGDFASAESAWQEALRSTELNPKAAFHLVTVQAAQGKSLGVLQTTSMLIDRYPDKLEFLNAIAGKLWDLKQADSFERITTWLQGAAGARDEEHLELAKLFAQAGQTRKALIEYERCERSAQIGEACGENRIRLLLEMPRSQGERDREIAAFAEAHPKSPLTAQLQARLLMDAGNPAEAIPILVKLAANNPSDLDVLLALARAYEETGQSSLALGELQVCQRLEPESNQVLLALARYYLSAREYETAKLTADRVLKKESSNREAQVIASEALGKIHGSTASVQ